MKGRRYQCVWKFVGGMLFRFRSHGAEGEETREEDCECGEGEQA